MMRPRGRARAADAYAVLFLCTGNAARSILAEAILRRRGARRFTAYSAGSKPKGEVSAAAIALLEDLGYPTADLRPKSWTEFAAPDAPRLDLVVTVCDSVAGEACPIWPGQPLSAHWGVPDPAVAGRSQGAVSQALADAHRLLERRISAFCALPFDSLDGAALRARIEAIGKID